MKTPSYVLRSGLGLALLLGAAGAVSAQAPEFKLFDKFVLTVGGAYSDVATNLRLDSKLLGQGTEVNFEDDLGLGAGATSFDLKFEWQIAKRHRLFGSYLDLNRSDSSEATSEFQIGDLIIPVMGGFNLDFDITDFRVGYTYYPWMKEKWAVGFIFGVRVLDVNLKLDLLVDFGGGGVQIPVTQTASVVGPLPFLGVDYRYAFSPRWIFTAKAGWLEAKIDKYDGSQWIADASVESRLSKHLGLGASLGYSFTDVKTEDDNFLGTVDLSYTTGRVFLRAFWN